MSHIERAVNILNQAYRADPEAISKMFAQRYSCNDNLADHPTIEVAGGDDAPHVGVIGIINGIVADITGEKVAVIYDERGLAGFTVYLKKSEKL
jgi:hypothetical protein